MLRSKTPQLKTQLHRIITRSISKDASPKSSQQSDSSPEEVQSAIVERMKQILEDKITTQSATSLSAMRNADPSLNKIISKYESSSSSLPNINQASSYIKSEPLLSHNKHAKDIYNAQPWTGEESVHDSNLRMIIDTAPKPVNEPSSVLYKKKRSSKEKLAMARDVSLDYKVNKVDNNEDDGFREMYREKLLGPSMLLHHSTSSVDFVESLAGNKINATINQSTGKFEGGDMDKVRGKPLDRDHLKNCTDSNYFMNQILKKQEVRPPWIENQQELNRHLETFRRNLDEMWFKWIINHSEISYIVHSATILETIENAFERNIPRFTGRDELGGVLDESDMKYIKTKTNMLNQEIRNYNLQCPTVAGHKFKLLQDKEIKDSYWRTLENFPITIQSWFDKNKVSKKSKPIVYESKGSGGMLNLWGGDNGPKTIHPSQIHVNRNVDTKLHVWKAIKDAFSFK